MKKKSYRIKYNNKINENENRIENRYKFLIVLIIILLGIIIGYLFYIQIVKNEYFKEKVEKSTIKIVEGDSAPRGRIYDRNGRLIVNNVAVKTITYKKTGLSTKEEVELAYKVSKMLDINYKKLKEKDLRNFWLINNKKEAKKFITEE